MKDTDVIEQIYATIRQPELWSDTLSNLAKVLNSSHAFIAARHSTQEQPFAFIEHGFSDGHFQTYQEHFYKVDVWTQALANHTPNRFHASHAVYDDKAFKQSEIYNDFARPADIRHSIGCLLLSAQQPVMTELAFMRGEGDQQFSAGQAELASSFLKHIQQSLLIGQQLQVATQADNSLHTFLNTVTDATLICSTKFELHYNNNAAEQLLRQSRLLHVGLDKKLRFENLSTHSQVQQLVEQLVWSERNSLDTSLLTQAGDVRYRINIQPWFEEISTPWGKHKIPALIITVKPIATRVEISAEIIRELFNLTIAEAEVCAALCSGLTTQEIAKQRNASIGTVRQQIKTCLSKTQTNSQSQLVAKLITTQVI
ncbi:helix-turn-helix transcriptional regulator [Saccharophagus degradans]|uniref:Regulatory protein, LuxR n=1 Tax=Saccharophagus degradans (strain 2-40 / ATCC 43961 / DSM 17024) TaxID=203122 RepID=Q21PQ3_SACD2|nr:helix-turn-helix transcriptional regulator [Saccharophagus degradans]ABD79326.1 regulatory protein, LuxR [Saccharophagus degradans 2-40]